MKKISSKILFIIGAIVLVLGRLTDRLSLLFFLGAGLTVIATLMLLYTKLKKTKEEKAAEYYSSFWTISIVFFFIFSALFFVMAGFAINWSLDEIMVVILIIISLFIGYGIVYLYFLPYIKANSKKHPQTKAIYTLNIFAAWTIVAWVIALIWSNTEEKENIIINQSTPNNTEDLKKYKELLDEGVITQEEFDAKKKQILDL